MRTSVLSVMLMAAISGAAVADVQVLSRTSSAQQYSNRFGNDYDDFQSQSGEGSITITLPQGHTHTSTVTPELISGGFYGSSSIWPDSGSSGSSSSLDATIRIRGGADVTIELNGEARPYGSSGTDSNAHFIISRISDSTVVFDSIRDGGTRWYSYSAFWYDTTWTGSLPAGDYRIRAGGNGTYQEFFMGSGVGVGNLYVTMSLVSPCAADFNADGFVDFFDYDGYVECFETGVCPEGANADFNGDAFVDFFDYDDFVLAFESGC